jgi:hypothetical protein
MSAARFCPAIFFHFVHDTRELLLKHKVRVRRETLATRQPVFGETGGRLAEAAEVATPEIIDAVGLECST